MIEHILVVVLLVVVFKKCIHANIKCGDNTYEGEIKEIQEYAVETDGKPKVRVKIKINSTEGLYIGLEVDVSIFATAKDSVMIVPIEAVYTDGDSKYVYVIENESVVRKTVQTGISSDKYTEIKEGLSTDDIAITDSINDSSKGKRATSK